MSNKDCLVIVPAYNEAQNIKKVLKDLNNYFENILIIDDGSNDKSIEILKSCNVPFIKHPINLGQGAAIDSGFCFFLESNKYDYVITFDADGQNRAIDAHEMINFAKKYKYDAVLGSRFKNIEYLKQIPMLKRFVLILAKFYERLFFRINLSDAHNGLRILKRDLVKKNIYPLINFDMNHATEISYKICKSNFRFQEFPVLVEYKNKRSQSPINAINLAVKNFFKLR